MGVPYFEGCNKGVKNRGDRYVYLQGEEHSGIVYISYPHYAPIPGYGEEADIADTDAVLGAGGTGITRQASVGGWVGWVGEETGMERRLGTGTRVKQNRKG